MSASRRLLKVVDLFAGCGGLSEGFVQAGNYRFVAHVDWERAECTTLKRRVIKQREGLAASAGVLRFDIQRVDELLNGWTGDPEYGSSIGIKALARQRGGVDVIVGGPPCQAYSIAGRIRDEHGMHFDYRNYLFEAYVKVVKEFRPRAFVFENVPGILSAKPGGVSVVDRIRNSFDKIGYVIIGDLREYAVLDCTEYGVPQKRSRVILLGLDKQRFGKQALKLLEKFYVDILPRYKSAQQRTVRDAIGGLPEFRPFKADYTVNGRRCSHRPLTSNVPNHAPRYHSRRDIAIFRELASDIETGANRLTSINALKKIYTERTGKTSNVHKYYVLRWDQPSNTIPAHLYKDGLRHIHPDPTQARSITVREAARLQSFGDEYVFYGSATDQYRMVGNAVPPSLGRALGMALYELLSLNSAAKRK